MSDRIRLGVIGCGGFARYHLNLIQAVNEFEVAGLCDPDPDQIETSKLAFPRYRDAPSFSHHQEMLTKVGLDAVLVCSPHTLHCGQVLDAFDSGLHVLVEKPLATSVTDCARLIEARDTAGKVGAVSYQRHGSAQFTYVRDILSTGRYGQVLALNSHLTQQWLQLTRGTWRQMKSLSGGGQINDSGSHMIDILLWMTDLRAKRVSAMMSSKGTEVDINSVVSIEFENGAFGSLTIVGDASMWHERHSIWLEKAAMLMEGDEVLVIEEDGRHIRVTNWPPSVTPDQNFADAILGKAQVLAPFECGLRTMELTEAAWRSAESDGTPVLVSST